MTRLRCLATVLVALTLVSAGAGAQEIGEINFGVIATEATSNLKKIWEPYLDDMSKATGYKVNGFYASDYAGVIEAMRFKKVQLAWVGGKAAMEAVNRSNSEVFAQSVDRENNPGYWSHVIVHKDAPFEKLDDVLKCDKSIDFSIGDPNSTSGFLVPTTYIFAARNIDPKSCFRTLRNASHEANAMAVLNKQVMAATMSSEGMRRLEHSAPDAPKSLRVIWTSPLIPNDPLVWRKDIPADMKARLQSFVLSYGRVGTPEEIAAARKKLAVLQYAPFNPSNDDQLLPIRILEANKTLLRVKGDDRISEDEKNKQIAALEADIRSLQERQVEADKSDFAKMRAAFVEADKAGKQDELKRMIAELTSKLASATH
jgi:phosphonate transport system substrate-binding protein